MEKQEKSTEERRCLGSTVAPCYVSYCDFCGGRLGDEYWDIDYFGWMVDCLLCGRSQSI